MLGVGKAPVILSQRSLTKGPSLLPCNLGSVMSRLTQVMRAVLDLFFGDAPSGADQVPFERKGRALSNYSNKKVKKVTVIGT